MKYTQYLKTLTFCPFCNLEEKEILKKNKFAKVILAKAPYHTDHLLVIPNKHALKMSDLTNREKLSVFELISWAQINLEKYHKNLSILYREGDKIKIGKSIDHFHVNLIPDEQIGSISVNAKDRLVFSQDKYVKETKHVREKFG